MAGSSDTTRRRIAWVSATNWSSSATRQTIGHTMSTNSWASSRSPAIGRALSIAWNSQFFAQRS